MSLTSRSKIAPFGSAACSASERFKRVELAQVCTKVSVGLATAVTPFMVPVGVKLIRNQNIRPNKFDSSSIAFVAPSFAASQPEKIVRPGDVVIVRTGANIGDACVVPQDFDGAQTFTTLIARPDPDLLVSEYLAQFINSHLGRSEVERLMAGGGKGNLNSGQLRHFRILLPSVPEQRAIAAACNCWDTAIEKSEQLVKAKKVFMRAYSSRLLTNPAWSWVPISDLFCEVNRKLDSIDIPVATISAGRGFLTQEERFNRRLAGENIANYTELHQGEFAYNKGNSKTYEFGCVYLLASFSKIAVPNVYVSFRPKVALAPEFYALWFETDLLKTQLRRVVNSGIRNDGLLNINADAFFKLTLPNPPLRDQESIARLLMAIKEEISLLERKSHAFRKQKHGLMQTLLGDGCQLPALPANDDGGGN
jgi:type I restriction enzyme S subunit